MDILKKKDKLGAVIEKWATKKVGNVLFCTLCDKHVKYEQGGINQINQHVGSETHKKRWKNLNPDPNKQTTFQPSQGQFTLSKPLNEAVTESEILLLFKLAEEDWSFSSCDHLDQLFARMFPGSNVAEKFGVGHTKAMA